MPETKTAVKEPSSFSLSGFPESEKSISRINAPLEPIDPDKRFQDLLQIIRQYHPSDDVSLLERAYAVAKEAHGDQKRHSGEPYITHPVEVAIILAELEMDKETIIAALLHDVVEDTGMTLDEVRKDFGDEVAELVDGVTKMGYGGGSCQISSTLYNTVLQLPGITIVERHPHGASGAAYLPHGVDASSGDLNFKMRNSYSFPIRIEASCHDLCLFMAIYRADV